MTLDAVLPMTAMVVWYLPTATRRVEATHEQ